MSHFGGEFDPILVDRAEFDRHCHRHRTGASHFDRLFCMRLEIQIFIDNAQPARRCQAPHGTIASHAVVAVKADFTQRFERFQSGQSLVPALKDVPTSHFAVVDDVDPGFLLIADRHLDRVAESLVDVALAIFSLAHFFQRRPQPTRISVAPDDRSGKKGSFRFLNGYFLGHDSLQ